MANKTIEELLISCEELCDTLRKLRREKPNEFYDRAYEKLLKNIDSSLQGFYSWSVTEERETHRLQRELSKLRQENYELQRSTDEGDK